MRILWTLIKLVVVLALVIPLGIFVMATALGVFGALIGLAVLALRIACLGLVGYGVYRVARFFFGSSPRPQPALAPSPPRDPYYDAAMRELDREFGPTATR